MATNFFLSAFGFFLSKMLFLIVVANRGDIDFLLDFVNATENVLNANENVAIFDLANENVFDLASANVFDHAWTCLPRSDLMKSAVAVAAVREESPAEIRLAEIQALQVESLEVDRRVGNLRMVGEQRLKRVCEN